MLLVVNDHFLCITVSIRSITGGVSLVRAVYGNMWTAWVFPALKFPTYITARSVILGPLISTRPFGSRHASTSSVSSLRVCWLNRFSENLKQSYIYCVITYRLWVQILVPYVSLLLRSMIWFGTIVKSGKVMTDSDDSISFSISIHCIYIYLYIIYIPFIYHNIFDISWYFMPELYIFITALPK